MSAAPSSYSLCTTTAHVLQSLRVLRTSPFLIFDCEGHELGCQGGALSLLTIGTHNFSEVFVYDAVQLNYASLTPILRLLARPDILKVVWDGRMDYSEIHFSYGTRFENVLDLQVVEVASRRICGESEDQRLKRLKSYFPSFAVRRFKAQYNGLQTVVGLQRCLHENSLALEDGKDADVVKLHTTNQTDLWMSRPLPEKLLAYAAKDIYLIHLIFDHFNNLGYLNLFPNLLAQSRRYVSIHVDLGARPVRGDCFRSSPVMPLDVLQEPTAANYVCAACQRRLSLHCFTARHGYQQRSRICRVCYVVGKRNEKTDHEGWVALV